MSPTEANAGLNPQPQSAAPKRPPRRRGHRGGARRRGRKPIGDFAVAAPPPPSSEGVPPAAVGAQPLTEPQSFAEAASPLGAEGEVGLEPGPTGPLAAHGIDEEIEPVDLTEPPEAAPVAESAAAEPPAAPTARPDRPLTGPPREAPPYAPPARGKAPLDDAIEHAERIAANLKAALEDMEEILELLEIAQVQKSGDDREITDLRRALQRLQRHEVSFSAPGPVHGHSHGHGPGAGDRRPPGRSGPPPSQAAA